MRSQETAALSEAIGSDLHRPECVLTARDGTLWTSDWRGGVTRIAPDGTQRAIIDAAAGLKPNGIAILPSGSFLLANLGEAGGVWRLSRDGVAEPYLMEADGVQLPPCNFVLVDELRRTWITVSTRREPRDLAFRSDVADGFIVLVDETGARIVADGLGYTNEVQIDPSGRWLYVNETFGRRLRRFAIGAGGSLKGDGEVVALFGDGTYPDGLCFDSAGTAWITSPVSNRILCIDSEGTQTVFFEDADRSHVAWVEEAFQKGLMRRQHLEACGETRLRNLSSLAFGGADLKTGYLGSLQGTAVETIALPVAGRAPAHWSWT